MRLTHTMSMAVFLMAFGTPALAQTIPVTPSTPRPGQRVHISVPDCSVGTRPHTAKSAAFARDVTLYGKSDTGDADPTIKQGLAPGTYPITAYCEGTRTVRGEVTVAGGPSESPAGGTTPTPAASERGTGSAVAYWMLGAAAAIVIAGAGAVLWFSRRTRTSGSGRSRTGR